MLTCLLLQSVKFVAPQIASSLAPLRPSERELADILAQLKAHKLKLGSKIAAADLLALIEARNAP